MCIRDSLSPCKAADADAVDKSEKLQNDRGNTQRQHSVGKCLFTETKRHGAASFFRS